MRELRSNEYLFCYGRCHTYELASPILRLGLQPIPVATLTRPDNVSPRNASDLASRRHPRSRRWGSCFRDQRAADSDRCLCRSVQPVWPDAWPRLLLVEQSLPYGNCGRILGGWYSHPSADPYGKCEPFSNE